MLIRNAEIRDHGLADLRMTGAQIVAIGQLAPIDGEPVIDARGGALLPGLHDHHIHLSALAARQASTPCGPPQVNDETELAAALSVPGIGWLRGIGYHESVAGVLDIVTLDRLAPARPVRIQHRSGRMWFFNSAGLDAILAHTAPPPGLEREHGRYTGRLFDADLWLREALGSVPPALGEVSADLARCSVTGLTDMSPSNDPAIARHFAGEQASGALVQHIVMAGGLALGDRDFTADLLTGPAKMHLHEADFPDYDTAVAFVRAAHDQKRAVAVHCATEAELVFALSVIEAGGATPGDRIEHASVAPDELVAWIARLGLAVVSQPHFIEERGDQYRAAIAAADLPQLYRLRAFIDAGVTLAGGSDAPFGSADPWAAMRAAVSRRTRDGHAIGGAEALSPEEALALFLADPLDLSCERSIETGRAADLCLLDRPWADARLRLSANDVRATLISGRVVHERVDPVATS